MSTEREERVYQDILRMVLWGEPKDDVMRRLEVNGFTGDAADHLYGRAFDERLGEIFASCRRKIRTGALLIAGGAGLFWICWFAIGFTNRQVIALSLMGLGFGAWRVIDGFTGILTAKTREGSVTDDD
jgi:hypothetical protein